MQLLVTAEDKLILYGPNNLLAKENFFDPDVVPYRNYLAALHGEKIVGLVCFTDESVRIPGSLGIGFISVHPEHWHKGIASQLVTALFEHASAVGKNIANTNYEPMGKLYLRPVMQRVAAFFPAIHLFEREL